MALNALMHIDEDFIIHGARLPRTAPSPSWNGVVARSHSGCISVMCENGEVLLIPPAQGQHEESINDGAGLPAAALSFSVQHILRSPHANVMSMCQCWSPSGMHLVVVRDRVATIYKASETSWQVCSSVTLRFAASSCDIYEPGNDDDRGDDMVVVFGTVGGVHVYRATVNATDASMPLLVPQSIHVPSVAIAVVQLAPDRRCLAVGTVDGRILILRVDPQGCLVSEDAVWSKVLTSPRVTQITFSPLSDTIVVATRKGNVYVFTNDASGQAWHVDSKFARLSANPKPRPGQATISPTLACWCGHTPVFAVACRTGATELAFYDVQSGSLLHTLGFHADRDEKSAPVQLVPGVDTRRIVGLCFLPATTRPKATTTTTNKHGLCPRILCVDSNASILIIGWPFLQACCPFLRENEADP